MTSLILTLAEGTFTLHRKIPALTNEKEDVLGYTIIAHSKEEIDEKRAGQIMHWTRHIVAGNKLSYPKRGKLERAEKALADVYIKISRHPKQRERMENEALIYSERLLDLQGTIVPEYYGLYVGEGPGGQEMTCIILEKVDGQGPNLRCEMA